MSRSEPVRLATEFEGWLAREFADTGPFTALVVLVEIAETQVILLCSTFFNVIGDEIGWSDIVGMFQSSGREWNGAAFFPTTALDGGPLDNPTARMRLRELEARLADDRLVLNDGHFFDIWGRRLQVDELTAQ